MPQRCDKRSKSTSKTVNQGHPPEKLETADNPLPAAKAAPFLPIFIKAPFILQNFNASYVSANLLACRISHLINVALDVLEMC